MIGAIHHAHTQELRSVQKTRAGTIISSASTTDRTWRPAVVAEVYHDGCFSTGVPVVLSTDRQYKQMWWYYFEEEGTTWRRAEAGAPAGAARARGGEADPPPGSKRARRGASA